MSIVFLIFYTFFDKDVTYLIFQPCDFRKRSQFFSWKSLPNLALKHRIKLALFSNQLLGCPLLYQLAIFHHKYQIGLLNGR